MILPRWLGTVLAVVFVAIFVACAVAVFVDLFGVRALDPSIRKILFGSCVAQVLLIVLGWARGGVLPRLERHFSNPNRVNRYMKKFIERGSEIIIFSNSFSWVDDEIQEVLRQKMIDGQTVRFYVPKRNDKVDTMEKELGVTVRDYSSLQLEPRVRFTLLDRHRAGAERLAVGQGTPDSFRISEFRSHLDPQVVAIASMLVDVVDRHLVAGTDS